MTALAELLAGRGVKTAAVIDDAYDDVPRPSDLKDAEWSVFFDDLNDADTKLLTEQYPAFANASPSDLPVDPGFIAILWRNREGITKSARESLLSGYETQTAAERKLLDDVVSSLKGWGLTCTKMGRTLAADASTADLIFVDLFLGFTQSEADMLDAVQRIKALVHPRRASPPLVVLMSRSSRLKEKRNQFREDAGLLASTFRVVSKADLETAGELERLLQRLTTSYDDARRVAGFIHSWEEGLTDARDNFIKIIRRLDLPDFGQIRALLLEFEGQRLGDYLLDVCDGVLQHEIESNPRTIAAAQALNGIDLNKYPAPHLMGTTDLQDLVQKMVFQDAERLKLSVDGATTLLHFGDVLRWHNAETGAATNEVSLVVTPACDLVRDGVADILLLSGTLVPLTPGSWISKEGLTKTAIIELPAGGRFWIKWNLKAIRTKPSAELKGLLAAGASLRRVGRLRDVYALAIHQQVLSALGRIGMTADPPATFPVLLSFFCVNTEGNCRPVQIDEARDAVCYVGRNEGGDPVHRLVLREDACDAIHRTIGKLDGATLFRGAQSYLTTLRADPSFMNRFLLGNIEVSASEGVKPVNGADGKAYVYIFRGDKLSDGQAITGQQRNAVLLLQITEAEPAAEIGAAEPRAVRAATEVAPPSAEIDNAQATASDRAPSPKVIKLLPADEKKIDPKGE